MNILRPSHWYFIRRVLSADDRKTVQEEQEFDNAWSEVLKKYHHRCK